MWEGTRRHEMIQSEKESLLWGTGLHLPHTKFPLLSTGVGEGSPQPAPGWHLTMKGTASHFLYRRQEAWFSLSGLSEVLLSNSASKPQKFIF